MSVRTNRPVGEPPPVLSTRALLLVTIAGGLGVLTVLSPPWGIGLTAALAALAALHEIIGD